MNWKSQFGHYVVGVVLLMMLLKFRHGQHGSLRTRLYTLTHLGLKSGSLSRPENKRAIHTVTAPATKRPILCLIYEIRDHDLMAKNKYNEHTFCAPTAVETA